MDTFVVREKTWLHSGNNGALLNSSGNRCCLGFYCNQILSVTDNEMFKRSYPSSVYQLRKYSHTQWLMNDYSIEELFGLTIPKYPIHKHLEQHIGDINDLEFHGSKIEVFSFLTRANLCTSWETFLLWKKLTLGFLFIKYGGINVVFE